MPRISAAQLFGTESISEFRMLGGEGTPETELQKILITSLALDSRVVTPGAAFFALSGENVDGISFLEQAAANGAVLAVVSESSAAKVAALNLRIPVLLTPDTRAVVSSVADHFFGTSVSGIEFIGVTGTNGKTSVAWIVSEALAFLGAGTGYIGTLGKRVLAPGGRTVRFDPSLHTTPEAFELHQTIAASRGDGAARFAIEVSSHGISQRRVDNIPFQAAIFTNLTRDHLDFHKTLEAYGETKMRLFTELLSPAGLAVINIDDPFGPEIVRRLEGTGKEVIRLTRDNSAARTTYEGVLKSAATTRRGIEMTAEIKGKKTVIRSSLVGDYNVMNLLSAAGLLTGLGYAPNQITAALRQVRAVPGRLELAADTHPAVYIDYAHTPDGLVNALNSVIKLRQSDPEASRGRIITVFGCGGNRDRGKRPLMGHAVSSLSDLAVVTSDNPRFESPADIIADILPGMTGAGINKIEKPGEQNLSARQVEVFTDRREAIHHAIKIAGELDIVVIAGKGHETYQEISGERYPFSDVDVAREALVAAGQLKVR